MRRPGLVITVVALSVLLLAEGLARALEPRLGSQDRWPLPELGDKIDQMEAIAASGERADVAVVGASTVKWGIDPRLVQEAGDVSVAYNAGVGGMPLDATRQWVEHFVLPSLNPRILAIGVTAIDLNDAGAAQAANARVFFESPAFSRAVNDDHPFIKLTTLLEDNSALFRIRPVQGEITAEVEQANTGPDVTVGPRGVMAKHPRLSYVFNEGFRNVILPRLLTDYQTGGRFRADLEELIKLARTEGSTPVLVRMPAVHDDVDPLFPSGAADVAAGERLLTRLADNLDVPLLDLNELPLDLEHFFDPVHLNVRGRALASTALGAWLDEHLDDGCHDAACRRSP